MEIWASGGEAAVVLNRITGPNPRGAYLEVPVGSDSRGIFSAERLAEAVTALLTPYTVSNDIIDGLLHLGSDDEGSFPFRLRRAMGLGGGPQHFTLTFLDKSTISSGPQPNSDDTGEDPRSARDAGTALLEPITVREFGGVERILQELWLAVDTDGLTEGQQAQIIALAALIETQCRDTEPGTTERWKLVGVVRGALAALFKGDDIVKNALAWSQIVETLAEIDWTHAADLFR